MAQRVNIVNVSDLSGNEGDDVATVEFGLDGVSYEIDLTEKEQEKFRDVLSKYVGAGRAVKGARKRGAAAKSSGPSPKVIREWAQANGYDVPARGRIPEDVREAYKAAN